MRKNDRKLTGRQARFVQHYADPQGPGFENATKSAELAGYKGKPGSNQLAVQGHANLRNPNVRREIERILDEAGATMEKVAWVLAEGMESKRPKVAFDGKRFHYSRHLPDRQERRLSAEMVCRLRAAFPTTQEQERLALLAIQQNIVVVPPLRPGELSKEPEAKQLRVVEE